MSMDYNDRLANIDWLCVSGLCKIDLFNRVMERIAGTGDARGLYRITFPKRDYSTAQFREVYDVTLNFSPVAEICRTPVMPTIDPATVLIRIKNRYLYQYAEFDDTRCDYTDILNIIIESLGITNVKLSRLDVCVDMFKTDSDILFPEYLRQIAGGELRKVSRCYGSFFFEARNGVATYHCMNIGSKHSDVTLKVYNKTKEMSDETYKPYIYEAWCSYFGFDRLRDVNVWRVELSFTGKSLSQFDTDTGEILTVDSGIRNVALLLFTYYIKRFADFRRPRGGRNVTRWQSVVMIDPTKIWFERDLRRCAQYCSEQGERQLIVRLHKEKSMYQGDEGAYLGKLIDEITNFLVGRNGLHDWFKYKVSNRTSEAKPKIAAVEW